MTWKISMLQILIMFLLGASVPVMAATVSGSVISYTSPHGSGEQCVILDRMPGGVYSDEDTAQENVFCDIDSP